MSSLWSFMKNQIQVKINPKKACHYPVLIESQLIEKPTHWIPRKYKNIVIITDNKVRKIYADPLLNALKQCNTLLISFPAGEKYKNIKTKLYIEDQMLSNHYGKDSLIIALGGGVVGDIARFVAATYMRGIPYIQVPTTLLAMVDSSIGGKTGIDTPHGKNMIGALWQPKAVIADLHCLKTLSKKQIINGLVESIKMFLTNDLKSFKFVRANLENILLADKSLLKDIVQKSIKVKSGIIKNDEHDNHQRMVLNFGHTIGHALEKITNYMIMHGYAVGLGILVEAKISECWGILSHNSFRIIESVFADLGITANDLKKFNITSILQATKHDKKIKSNQVRYVLLQDIGKIYKQKSQIIHSIPDSFVKQTFNSMIGA